MTWEDQLWEMEERFWLDGAEAARTRMANDAVMIFPYPTGILQGEACLEGMKAAPRWRTVRMDDRVVTRRGDVAVLAYRVSAERAGEPISRALRLDLSRRRGNLAARVAPADAPCRGRDGAHRTLARLSQAAGSSAA